WLSRKTIARAGSLRALRSDRGGGQGRHGVLIRMNRTITTPTPNFGIRKTGGGASSKTTAVRFTGRDVHDKFEPTRCGLSSGLDHVVDPAWHLWRTAAPAGGQTDDQDLRPRFVRASRGNPLHLFYPRSRPRKNVGMASKSRYRHLRGEGQG